MKLSHCLVPFLSLHRFLAETRCEVTSAVLMTENHTPPAAEGCGHLGKKPTRVRPPLHPLSQRGGVVMH